MSPREGDGGERLAPVAYLPGVVPPPAAPASKPRAVAFSEEYWADETPTDAAGSGDEPVATAAIEVQTVDRDTVLATASQSLTRSLGRRGLSVAEAKSRLRAEGLTDDESADILDDFTRRGWLDDTLLAEQLVHSATTRKDMGTKAIRQLLIKRMVARDVIDAVIGELPDDDAERALEIATGKARSLVRYDDETAMRRLMGMLARRGFGGSVASTAARAALADARRQSGGVASVRFR